MFDNFLLWDSKVNHRLILPRATKIASQKESIRQFLLKIFENKMNITNNIRCNSTHSKTEKSHNSFLLHFIRNFKVQ